MQIIKVKQGQSFFDVVTEVTGDISNAFDMALINNISITDVLPNQTELIIHGTEKKSITKLFESNKVATEITLEQSRPSKEGIDHWAINIDFIVK